MDQNIDRMTKFEQTGITQEDIFPYCHNKNFLDNLELIKNIFPNVHHASNELDSKCYYDANN